MDRQGTLLLHFVLSLPLLPLKLLAAAVSAAAAASG
jgi:hypothetical protein